MTHIQLKAPRVVARWFEDDTSAMLKRNRAAVAVLSFLLVQASILVLFSGGVPPASAAPEELCPDGVCAASDRILLPRVIVGCWQLLERNPRPEAAVETLLSYARAGFDSFGTALLPRLCRTGTHTVKADFRYGGYLRTVGADPWPFQVRLTGAPFQVRLGSKRRGSQAHVGAGERGARAFLHEVRH